MGMKENCRGSNLAFELLEPRLMLSASPTNFEQEMLWLVNDMRTNPADHLDHFINGNGTPATSQYSNINTALSFFNVNGSVLETEFGLLVSTGPVAWSDPLDDAAYSHSETMITHDSQSHQLPGELDLGDRVTAAGYSWGSVGENIYGYAENAIYGHAAFAVDWGTGPDGMQAGRGHRVNIMDSDWVHVGIGVINETDSGTDLGPYVVTQDFARPLTPSDYYLVGTIWDDANSDNKFNGGEGLGGVSITAVGASTYSTTSWASGGYQLQLPDGSYDVTIEGGPFTGVVTTTIVISGGNQLFDANPLPPTAFDDGPVIITEDSGANTIDVLANDTDTNMSIISVTQGSNGSVAITNGGLNLTYTPDPDYVGADTFTYTMSGDSGSGTATVTMGVLNGDDDPPVALDDLASVAEDSIAVQLDVLGNDYDPDPLDTITITGLGATDNGGSVSIGGGGAWVNYTPLGDFYGTETFTYTIQDSSGDSVSATVTVEVSSVNDNPVASDDTVALTMNSGASAIDVLANDSVAPDIGEVLTIIGVTQGSDGTAVITGGGTGLTYQPDTGFFGNDTFVYTISDGNGGTDTATVTVTVNDAPVLPAASPDLSGIVGAIDVSIFVASAFDPQGTDIGVAVTGESGLGSWEYRIGTGLWQPVGAVSANSALLLGSDDQVRYVAGGASAETGTISYRAWDGMTGTAGVMVDVTTNGGTTSFSSGQNTASITTSGVNDAPVNTVPDDQTVVPGTSVVFSGSSAFSVYDEDLLSGDLQVTLSVAGSPGGTLTLGGTDGLVFTGGGDGTAAMTFTGTMASVNVALNGLTYTPTGLQAGVATITIVTDDQGNSGTGSSMSDTDTVDVNVFRSVVISNSSTTYTDANGEIVTASHKGQGVATLYFDTVAVGDVHHVVANNTDTGSMLTFKVKGTTTIGGIDVTGSMKQISAKTASLTGDLNISGNIAKILFDDITNSMITIGAGVSVGTTLQAGRITDTSIDASSAGFKSLTFKDWQDTGGTADSISARYISSFSAKGDRRQLIAGDSHVDMNLHGVDTKGYSLGKLTATGDMTSDINLANAFKSITAGGVSSGSLDATWGKSISVKGSRTGLSGDLGADITLTGVDSKNVSISKIVISGTFTSHITTSGSMGVFSTAAANGSDIRVGLDSGHVGRFANDSSDYVNQTAFIKSVQIKGVKGGDVATRFTTDFLASAASIGKISIINPDPAFACGVYVLDGQNPGLGSATYKDLQTGAKETWKAGDPLPAFGSNIDIVLYGAGS